MVRVTAYHAENYLVGLEGGTTTSGLKQGPASVVGAAVRNLGQ